LSIEHHLIDFLGAVLSVDSDNIEIVNSGLVLERVRHRLMTFALSLRHRGICDLSALPLSHEVVVLGFKDLNCSVAMHSYNLEIRDLESSSIILSLT
jgi:hypothetical protein